MTDKDRKKQKAVLAELATLPPGVSIEEWNALRFSPEYFDLKVAELELKGGYVPKIRWVN